MGRPPIPLLLSLVALALAGCGGGGGGGGGASSTSGSTPTTAAKSGGAVTVSMKNIAFNPASITAKVGQKVTWTNDDSVPHNVIARSGATFASATFGPGGSFSFTPKKAGTINYVCTIHPGMVGKIVVVK